jgi:hypothetical protein
MGVGFSATYQLLIIFSGLIRYWERKWECNGEVHHLFIDFKKAYVSVRKEVLYGIGIAFSALP